MDSELSDSVLIRQEKRRYRQSLNPIVVSQASAKARELLRKCDEFLQANTIAIYYPSQGELDPLPLMRAFPEKTFALPVILTQPHNHLHFYQYDSSAALHANKFGIDEPEPIAEKHLQPADIDLILVPMVAFDEGKNRMGHGAGFYDRSLAFPRESGLPHFVGFAYDWQKVANLPVKPWDVPMDWIVTDQKIYR